MVVGTGESLLPLDSYLFMCSKAVLSWRPLRCWGSAAAACPARRTSNAILPWRCCRAPLCLLPGASRGVQGFKQAA